MTAPVRIQLFRRKGFDLQAHSRAVNGLEAVNVARPSRYGNPFRIGHFLAVRSGEFEQLVEIKTPLHARTLFFEEAMKTIYIAENGGLLQQDIAKGWTALRGKNLACWCKPGDPCHADVLLEIANRPICEGVDP